MKTRAPRVHLCLEELEQRWVPSTAYSTNWSGFAVSAAAGTVTAVSGSWVVPQIVSGSNNGYSSAWVGIDGYNSSSVEQLGTDSDMVNGTPQYYAWWEMYPNPSYKISGMTVKPGDSISASVSYTSGSFVLQITDGSQSFKTTQGSSTAQLSSAEWIQEAPSSRASCRCRTSARSISRTRKPPSAARQARSTLHLGRASPRQSTW